MKNLLINIAKYSIGAGLGVFLLWLAFTGVDVDDLVSRLKNAHYNWILYTIPVVLLSHFLRAWRWKLLMEASGYSPSTLRTFSSVLVGYLVNQAIPRGGEVARCTMLYRASKVPLSVSMGTVLIERVFDVIVLLLFVVFFLFMETDRLMSFFNEKSGLVFDKFAGMGLAAIIIAGLIPVIGILAFRFFWKKLKSGPLFSKISGFLAQMLNGAKSIFRLKSPALFLALTASIWGCYGIMTWMSFFCLDGSSGFSLYFAFVLMIMGGIGMTLPAPGGIGPYHAAIKFTVVAFYAAELGTEAMEQLGITLGTIMQASQLVMLIVVGFVAWIYLSFSAPENSADAETLAREENERLNAGLEK